MKIYKYSLACAAALAAVLILALGSGNAPSAFAQAKEAHVVAAQTNATLTDADVGAVSCNARGSIGISVTVGISCPGNVLIAGQTKDIDILITNESKTQPIATGTPVPATLRGTITYTLACTDTGCSVPLSGTLAFVPVVGNGCVSSDPGVASCTMIDANHVGINMTAGGVPLAAAEMDHFIATIRVQAATPPGSLGTQLCGGFGERAETGTTDLITNSNLCSPQATGGAQGSTSEVFPTPTPSPTPTPTQTPTPTPTPTQTPTPTPTPTPPPGLEGCTPGFWKANCDKKNANAWPGQTCATPLLSAVFTIPPCLDNSHCRQNFQTITLRDALSLQGGSSLCSKAEILYRAAAAAYLNSVSSCVQYPITTTQLQSEVNAAAASCDAGQILAEAGRLDAFNNSGCPLDQQGRCSHP